MIGRGQTSQSPYTALGIGEIITPRLVSNMGMGISSVAYPSNKNFNLMNPAFLGLRDYYTTFEVGFTGEQRTIKKDTLNQTNGSGNLNYFALAFPIKRSRWASGIGLIPYSYVNYNIISTDPINGVDDVSYMNFTGEGGMNSIFWSNGFNFFKTFAVGVKIQYLTGSRIDETLVNINQPNSYSSALHQRTKYNDFSLSFGATYWFKTGEKSTIFLAGTYDMKTEVNTRVEERLERRQIGSDNALTTDTITDLKGDILLPSRIGAGITFVRGSKWLLTADILIQDWSVYRNFVGQSELLTKSYRTGLGMEIIPDGSSVNSYFKRISYRFGGFYEITPYEINSDQIYNFGINFGVSLPAGQASLVNFAAQYGQQTGSLDTSITENYFRVSLGFSISDIWFYRRKIE
jgi:hypothetical protein